MAKHQFVGQNILTGIRYQFPRPSSTAPTVASAGRCDATNEQFAMCGRVWFKERTGSKTIVAVHWYENSAVAGTFSLRLGLQDLTAAGLPDGTFDHYKDLTATTTGAMATTFDTGSSKTVNYRQKIAVVWKMMSWTSGRTQPGGLNLSAGEEPMSSGYCKFDTAGDWSAAVTASILANLVFEFSDGTFGTLENATPAFIALNTESFNNTTAGSGLGTGNERALRFTTTAPWWVDASESYVGVAGTSSDFDTRLYNGTTLLGTGESQDVSQWTRTSGVDNFGIAADQPATSGNTYYYSFRPTSGNNITIYTLDFASSAHALLAFGGLASVGYDCASGTLGSGGSWQNPANSDRRVPICALLLSAADDGTGGGGSGGAALSRVRLGH
jgi:hypothetical protein